jgi:hypothetical protein
MLEFLRSLVLHQEAQVIQENQGNQHFKVANQWPVQEVL